MQRKTLLAAPLLWAALWLAAASVASAGERFLSVIDDLPLMPALTEIEGSAVAFAKPGGRIVEVAASGRTDEQSVLAFYGGTLPQLGWRPESAVVWLREGERLTLAFEERDGGLVVQFSLSPR